MAAVAHSLETRQQMEHRVTTVRRWRAMQLSLILGYFYESLQYFGKTTIFSHHFQNVV